MNKVSIIFFIHLYVIYSIKDNVNKVIDYFPEGKIQINQYL